MDKRYCIDTNVLLETPEIIKEYNSVILSHVVRELEKHKISKNTDLSFRARRATRYIDEHVNDIVFDFKDYHVSFDDHADNDYVDNKIIQSCLDNEYSLITNDLLLKHKALGYGIEVISNKTSEKDNSTYTGVHELYIDDTQKSQQLLARLYEHPEDNIFDLVANQYLCVWDKTKPTYNKFGELNGYEPIDQFKFDGERLVKLRFKNIDNGFMGKIKPINVKQKLLFDALQDRNTTVKSVFGSFGVGKDFVMISHAVNLLLQGKMDRIVWIRNNVEVKDSNPIGFLPNSLEDKLRPFLAPLMDHVGGQDGLDSFLRDGRVEIQHLGFLRGRDIKNSIIYVTECQGNTREHIQLLLGRVGEGSQIWLNGDLKQIDDDKFKHNNGVSALKKLGGHELYSQVTLDKIERSKTAELAELI